MRCHWETTGLRKLNHHYQSTGGFKEQLIIYEGTETEGYIMGTGFTNPPHFDYNTAHNKAIAVTPGRYQVKWDLYTNALWPAQQGFSCSTGLRAVASRYIQNSGFDARSVTWTMSDQTHALYPLYIGTVAGVTDTSYIQGNSYTYTDIIMGRFVFYWSAENWQNQISIANERIYVDFDGFTGGIQEDFTTGYHLIRVYVTIPTITADSHTSAKVWGKIWLEHV